MTMQRKWPDPPSGMQHCDCHHGGSFRRTFQRALDALDGIQGEPHDRGAVRMPIVFVCPVCAGAFDSGQLWDSTSDETC